MRSGDSLGVVYDRALLKGSLDFRRSFGGVGGTGAHGSIAFDMTVEFDAEQDDPLLLSLIERWNAKAQEEAVRYYARNLSVLGDF